MSTTIPNASGANSQIDYGIDASRLVRFFFLAGSAAALTLILVMFFALLSSIWGSIVKAVLLIAALYLIGMCWSVQP